MQNLIFWNGGVPTSGGRDPKFGRQHETNAFVLPYPAKREPTHSLYHGKIFRIGTRFQHSASLIGSREALGPGSRTLVDS